MPPVHELKAEPSWRLIEFISDLHLSESQPRSVAAWAAYLRGSQADAIFILGDLFEVWIGDDARQPGRFEQAAADVLAQATRHRVIGFMAGNRDFLLGNEMLRACGISALPDPTLLCAFDRCVLLTHGDALCLSDTAYQAFRAQVRGDAWRSDFLHRPLAERERLARQMRDASEANKRGKPVADWSDVDAPTAVAWLRAAGSDVMVHGHTHRPGSEALAPGFMRHVLSDWDCDAAPARAQVLRLTREGFARIDFAP
ncbi:MAG: UDP-2,3-diacylglucosamine diphosphatase [Burkholderiaceae bacterium]|nr:UDP-2,3-diacylglucosamine diphosphatase [Burkholderiaceae bacterium]